MNLLQGLLDKHELNPEEVQRMSRECRAYGAGYGTLNRQDVELSPPTQLKIDALAKSVWSNRYSRTEQIELAFQVHELFPGSYPLMQGFYHLKSGNDDDDPKIWNRIWQKFCEYLNEEDCLADPILYVLWVDFFETESAVEFAWAGLMAFAHTQKTQQRILESAGPVPYPLKEPLLLRMMQDTTNHECILTSLLQWSYDVYGKLDVEKAKEVLSKLEVDRESEDYAALAGRLGA